MFSAGGIPAGGGICCCFGRSLLILPFSLLCFEEKMCPFSGLIEMQQVEQVTLGSSVKQLLEGQSRPWDCLGVNMGTAYLRL